MGAYSKIKEIADLKNGAIVAIPADPSNSSRALALLQQQGLIQLKDAASIVDRARHDGQPQQAAVPRTGAAQLGAVFPAF